MVSTILVLFLFISYAQASDLKTMALNHGNVHMHQKSQERLLYEGMKEKNRLGEKVVERKNEISDTKRIAHGSGHVGRGGGGSSDMNRRSNPTHHNSATSLLQAVCFWVPNIDLFLASFAIIFIFLFN